VEQQATVGQQMISSRAPKPQLGTWLVDSAPDLRYPSILSQAEEARQIPGMSDFNVHASPSATRNDPGWGRSGVQSKELPTYHPQLLAGRMLPVPGGPEGSSLSPRSSSVS